MTIIWMILLLLALPVMFLVSAATKKIYGGMHDGDLSMAEDHL